MTGSIQVPDEQFMARAVFLPDVLTMSGLLTTIPQFPVVIDALEGSGLRRGLNVLVGGAPVPQENAARVGARGPRNATLRLPNPRACPLPVRQVHPVAARTIAATTGRTSGGHCRQRPMRRTDLSRCSRPGPHLVMRRGSKRSFGVDPLVLVDRP